MNNNQTKIQTKIQLEGETYTIVANAGLSGDAETNRRTSVENGDSFPGKVCDSSGSRIRVIRRSSRWKNKPRQANKGENELIEDVEDLKITSQNEFDSRSPTLPSPELDINKATKEANNRLHAMITGLRTSSTINVTNVASDLEYVAEVLSVLLANTEEGTVPDDLSELESEAVPEEVRKWLASTFAKQEQVVRRKDERPTFRSVANAIRTGIFIEKIYRRMSTSQLMVIPENLNPYLEQVNSWNFDMFTFSRASKGSPLKYLSYHLLQYHGCLHKFKIPPSTLESMLGHLEFGYARNSNPYHNNLHAADVLQTTHWFISQGGLRSWLSDLEIFSLLLSAIIHDYDHSGTTNNFHIQSGSPLTILYNDKSVLENHHVSSFFQTMIENDCNIMNNMSKSDFRDCRSLVIEMVLHTDMSMHFLQLKQMKTLLSSGHDGISLDKPRVLSLLLHTCDVSHPAKTWNLHHQWTSRCMEEFFKQGDIERERGLEFSPLCDRHNTMVPQSQIGFIDFIVIPTLTTCGEMVRCVLGSEVNGDVQCQPPWTDILAENRQNWQKKADDGERGIDTSDAVNDPKPPRVSSAITRKNSNLQKVNEN